MKNLPTITKEFWWVFYTTMIHLTKGQTQTIFFNASQNCLLTNPFFLFVFTNRITQEVIKFVATNTSTTLRYNKFALVTNSRFQTSEEGLWTYNVYEQASNSNTNITGLKNVENGYAYLHPATAFAPSEYNEQSNTFVTYNG
jgi:hypothetical protein